MKSPASSLSRISRRTAWFVIIAWVFAIGVLGSMAPTLDSVKSNDNDNPPADSMSMRAAALAAEEFGADSAPPAIIVVRSDAASATREATAKIVSEIKRAGLPAIERVVDSSAVPGGGGLVNEGSTAESVLVALRGSPSGDEYRDTVEDLRKISAKAADGGVEVAVTGPAGIAVDAVKVFGGSDKVLLLGTISLVVVLLFSIYRSPALVVVALVGVGFAMRLAEGVGALLADAGLMQISGQTSSIMTVLLFGVGTDYALIIFARFREAIAEYSDPTVAVARAMRSVAGALAASVSTIIAAVLALLAAVTPTLRDFGPYLALGVASMAVVAFTLTPALLVLSGRFAFWPRKVPSTEAELSSSRIWNRLADVVISAPRRVLAGGLAALVLMSGGLIGVQQSFDLVSGFRIDTESAAGQKMLGQSFGPGSIAPSQVLIRAESPLGEEQIQNITAALKSAPNVARLGSVKPSTDGQMVAVDVILDTNPYSPQAMDSLGGLSDAAHTGARQSDVRQAQVLVGGETSVAADTRTALNRDLVVVGLLMLLAVSVILGLVLRSLLAPLYLAATLVLSYAATMGLTAFITITLGGDLGIGNRVAVYVLVFLVALGVDYTIFMMTRYRQELAQLPPVEALRTSIIRTGGVISSAGVILAGTFAVLMTQPIRELYQFGLAMAIGILLDTFVVRPLLVPVCIRLLGRHALWPTRATHV